MCRRKFITFILLHLFSFSLLTAFCRNHRRRVGQVQGRTGTDVKPFSFDLSPNLQKQINQQYLLLMLQDFIWLSF